jgi:hypothetical protein
MVLLQLSFVCVPISPFGKDPRVKGFGNPLLENKKNFVFTYRFNKVRLLLLVYIWCFSEFKIKKNSVKTVNSHNGQKNSRNSLHVWKSIIFAIPCDS